MVPRDIMNIVITGDHRYGDGSHVAIFLKIMRDILTDPEAFNPDNYKDRVPIDELQSQKKGN